jgi:hypothetical protein
MKNRILRAAIVAGMFTTCGLTATVSDVSLGMRANIGPTLIHDFFGMELLKIRDEFSETLETPPFSGENYHFGGAVEIDVETGGFRARSNVSSGGGGNANVRWDGVMQVRVPIIGPPGPVLIPLNMTLHFGFIPDVGAVGSFVSAEVLAGLNTRQEGGDIENATYRYAYSETVGSTGSTPEVSSTFTGDVVVNSIFDVVLRTNLEYQCCSPAGMLIVATFTGGLSARLGGGTIDAFDSAFLTLNLPPGYSLEPGSPFLSKSFEQPQPIPEPWTAPVLGLVLACVGIRRYRHTRRELF